MQFKNFMSFSRRQGSWVLASCVVGLTLFSGVAEGQISNAAVNGVVQDSTGAVIPEAELTLTNVETGVERRSISSSVGRYSFLNLTPAIYTLEFGKEGFSTGSVQPFTLGVNQTSTLDLTLEVGAVTETVLVEAIGAQVQSSSSELGTVVGHSQVVDLPLNGRNFTQMLTLTPGASPVSTAQNRGGFGAATVGSFSYPSINGQSNRSNMFFTDGVNNHGATVSTYAVPPIIDVIQEFKVQSHNDSAEFGGASGGLVNVVTRSGANDVHGSGWWFMRSDKLDSPNYFRDSVTPLKQNMYGGTLGGKIVRNKTFYFLAYQGYMQRRPSDSLSRVPTASNLTGDMSDWGTPIYDPWTTASDGSGGFTRDAFANNIIPSSRLDQGFVNFTQAVVPTPNTQVGANNHLDSTPGSGDTHEYSARVDHTFNQKNTLWWRLSENRANSTGTAVFPSLESKNNWESSNMGASWVHTFSPTSILQVSFARTMVTRIGGRSFGDSAGSPTSYGVSEEYCCSFRSGFSGFPGYQVVGWWGNAGEANYKNFTSQDFQYKADYTKIVGNHTIKIGGEWNHLANSGGGITNDHNMRFETVGTSFPNGAGGSPFASFLLDVPTAASRRDFFKTLHRTSVSGFYLQDSWKVTNKLTVNLGYRYDYTRTPLVGSYEDGVIFTGTPDFEGTQGGVHILQAKPGSCAILGKAPCIPTPDGSLPEGVKVSSTGRLLNDWTDNHQPRLGIAYRFSDKTAFRSSFGMFYDSLAGLTQMTQAFGHTWPDVGQRQTGNLNTPSDAQLTPSISGKNPFPQGQIPAATPFGRTAWYGDPRIKNQYSMQWNMGIQHQLNPTTLISTNYVGSGNRRAPLDHFYNTAVTPGPGEIAPRRPFPFISPTFWQQSDGRANYHAFQFQLRKRTSNLTYVVNYTWSRTMNIGCDGWFGVEGCATQDPYNHSADWGVSGHDLTHMLNVNWVYQLPFSSKQNSSGNRAVDAIFGNWQVNGIVQLRSGMPYTVNMNGDIANTGNRNGYMRPNVVGNMASKSDPTLAEWFNTSAFAAPAPYTYGNAMRHMLRGDGVTSVDLSVFRNFDLSESTRLQFRMEAFNAFNHADFANPVANFSSGAFGQVTSTSIVERQLQMSVKLYF